jgi:hypothetical protein
MDSFLGAFLAVWGFFVFLDGFLLKASLETTFFHGIFVFPREISLFSLGKIEIPWENRVSKLALICVFLVPMRGLLHWAFL